MSNRILVSIIIPTYNRRDLLVLAVESCLGQTYDNIEIIIIDDGSTDGTQNMVSQLLKDDWKDENIIYYLQKNQGASTARNLGAKKAVGKYIQFLDSDDLLLPQKILLQVNKLEQVGGDCCYCCGKMGQSLSSPCERIGEEASGQKDLLVKLVSRTVHVMPTLAPLWKKEFLKNNKGWDEKISVGDDLEYHVRQIARTEKVSYLAEELFFVRSHSGSRLSADELTLETLESMIRTRWLVKKTLDEVKLWNDVIQGSFLQVMRTVYANTLKFGDDDKIKEVEYWLWKLATIPKSNLRIKALILLRKIIGRCFLLKLHDFQKKLTGN